MASTLINNIVNDTIPIEEVSQINNPILMELFEESQGDESDYEQLDDVIRSLEAEISPIEIDCENYLDEFECLIDSSIEDEGSIGSCQVGSCDWSAESPDYSWIDTIPSEGAIWYMEDYADEMNCMVEFDSVSVSDYSGQISLVEELGSCGSLWHESYQCDQIML